MRRFQLGVLIALLGLTACGSDDGTGGATGAPSPVPITYTLFQNEPGVIPASARLEAGPFTLPVAGTVTYTITNRSTTTPHHWDISIIAASEFKFFENGQPFDGFAPHGDVSTQSDSSAVPAGTYTIGIFCRNTSEKCQFWLDATMTY
jgi:hypothetical protein